MIDIQEKKTQIIKFLERNGPSLPVQVSREIKMDPLFASAILSELLGSREIKTSNLRVGASPLYLLPGQEEKLEQKTENLKSIEKETQEKLKSKKIISDESESPATRIALRNLKDFAIPFKFKDKIFWKYAFASQEEINNLLKPKEEPSHQALNHPNTSNESEDVPKAWETKKEEIKKAKQETKKVEEIFEKEKPKETRKEESTKSKTFLEEIEKFLESKNTKITSIEEVDKKKVVAIIESQNLKSMLFAFNKLRITEQELLKCYKDSLKKSLPYQIITKGDQTKKLSETISAYQKLLKVHKLE